MRQVKALVVDWVRGLRQEYPEKDGVHVLGVIEQAKGSLDFAGAKSEMIVDSVVARGPVDLDVGAAEFSQLVHVELNSDAEIIGERIGDADGPVGPLQAAGARLHGQVIVVGAVEKTLGGKAVDLDTGQVLRVQAARAEAEEKQ